MINICDKYNIIMININFFHNYLNKKYVTCSFSLYIFNYFLIIFEIVIQEKLII